MSAVQFGGVAPQLVVRDVVATAGFYRDVLGFEITDSFLGPPVHVIVTRGRSQVFLAKADGQAGTSNRQLKAVGLDAYFRVEGLEAFARDVAGRGAKILEGPVVRSYDVRELVVQDPNGFILVFGEDATGAEAGT